MNDAPEDLPVEDVDEFEAAVGAAYDKIESGDTDEAPEGAPEEQPESGPARDEHGRFTKLEEPEAAGSQGRVPAPGDVALEFPEHWSEARRATILGLPEQHRQAVLEQWREAENDLVNGRREFAEQRRGLEPLLAQLEPLRAQIAAQGVTPEAALGQFLTGMQRLRANPEQGLYELAESVGRPLAGSASAREMIRRLSQALGVDTGGVSADEQASADEWLDPRAAREVSGLQAQLSDMRRQIAAFTEHQQAVAMQQAASEAERFGAATGADGNPAHPHFQAVRADMARLIQAGVASDLAQAYQAAVWSRPELREQMLAAERKADAERREHERRASVAKAKAASAQPNGRSRPGQAPAESMDLDDALSGAVDRVLAQHAA